MKLGLIADIHANIEALDAVIAHLEAQAVDLIICAGDLVAYGANPNRVIERLKEKGITSVAGNYDDAVAWNKPKASRKASSKLNEPLKQAALEWSKAIIRPENKAYLKSLPWHIQYQFKGKSISILHAGLKHLDDWLEPENEALFANLADKLKSDVVVLAHTHRAFEFKYKNTLFINPGAVGRSLNGDTRAACATLTLNTLKPQFYLLEYDLAAAIEAIRKTEMPRGIALLVSKGARRIEEVRTNVKP